jgi:hypothetical protein
MLYLNNEMLFQNHNYPGMQKWKKHIRIFSFQGE